MLKVLTPVTTADSHYIVACFGNIFLRFGVSDFGFEQRDIRKTKRDIFYSTVELRLCKRDFSLTTVIFKVKTTSRPEPEVYVFQSSFLGQNFDICQV